MLHAVIRSGRDAFHFCGEVSGYNLQTLREHVGQSAKDDGAVHLEIEIDATDEETFARYRWKWLPDLAKFGAVVEVRLSGGAQGSSFYSEQQPSWDPAGSGLRRSQLMDATHSC